MKAVVPTGILWTGLEKVLLQGLGFVQGIILARLLCPEDFGLTAMLAVFIGIGVTLAESGLGTAYVVYGGNARRVLFWNVGLSLALYGALFGLAPFIARFYEVPVLCPLVRVIGLGIVLSAASVIGDAQLQRAQRFRELMVVNTLSTLVSLSVGVALAWYGAGVWAIAGVGLSGGVVRLCCLLPYVRIPRESTAIRPLLSYGGKLMTSGLIHAFYTNCYQMVIGKMFTPSVVGLFTRGQRWATLPGGMVDEAVARVALPNLAAGTGNARRYFWLNVVLLWPCLVVLWLFASEIVGWVLGPKWLDCVPYLRILLIGQVLMPVANIALTVLRASGHAEAILQADVVKAALGLLALAVGAGFGLSGLCWSVVACDVIEAVTDVVFVGRVRRDPK